MAKARKKISAKHIPLVRDYFRRKLATGDILPMLEEGQREKGRAALDAVLKEGSVQGWNTWADQYLSPAGRKTLWGALRGRSYREKNPRNELSKKVADQVRSKTGLDDVNDAVKTLLKMLE